MVHGRGLHVDFLAHELRPCMGAAAGFGGSMRVNVEAPCTKCIVLCGGSREAVQTNLSLLAGSNAPAWHSLLHCTACC